MKKTLHLLVFVLALATTLALAQMNPSATSPQTQNPTANPNPSMPSDQGTTAAPASQDTNKKADKKADKNSKSMVDDSTLDSQIKQQLSSDPAMKNVQASVSKGVVNLDGTVASKADKKRAKQMVAGIPGVRKVHDRLTVNANATVTPGSNEPATASAGKTGAATSSASTGASSTTPQTPSASAGSTTTPSHETGAAAGMPQSDTAAGANAGVGATGTQAGAGAAVGATGAQTGAGVSGTTSATTPQSPATAAPSTTPQSSTTGTAGASGTTSTLPQSSAEGTAGATAAGTAPAPGAPGDIGTDLQKQIQTALKHEPTLANDNINAVVTADTIDLSGSVASGKERQTALRIVQSFAGNRRVTDHLTVAGQGPGASTAQPQGTMGNTGASNPSATPSNPNASPESTNNPR